MNPENFSKIDPTKWYKEGKDIFVNVNTINLNLDCGLCNAKGVIRIENVMIDQDTGKAAVFFHNSPLLICYDCQNKIIKGDTESIIKSMLKMYDTGI